MTLVTLFTDASFHHRRHLGTWAAWIRMNGRTERASGILKDKQDNSCSAELSAIANALVVMQQRFTITGHSRVIIQTDCLEAITAIVNRSHTRPQQNEIVKYIRQFFATNKYQLDLRHVKGHKGAETRRSAVNTFCDEECRRQMGLALAMIDEEQLEMPLENQKPLTNKKKKLTENSANVIVFRNSLSAEEVEQLKERKAM